jgi:MFS family permease
MILGLLILASGTIMTYVTQYMTTYAENTLHVATNLAFATTLISNGVGIVAALLGGWLADRFGRWPVMVLPQFAALLGGLGILSLVATIPFSAFYVAFT